MRGRRQTLRLGLTLTVLVSLNHRKKAFVGMGGSDNRCGFQPRRRVLRPHRRANQPAHRDHVAGHRRGETRSSWSFSNVCCDRTGCGVRGHRTRARARPSGSAAARREDATIQDAVNAARAPAPTIKVCAGTYTEQVADRGRQEQRQSSSRDAPWQPRFRSPPTMTSPKAIVEVTAGAWASPSRASTSKARAAAGVTASSTASASTEAAPATIVSNHIDRTFADNPFSGCQNGVGILVGRALGQHDRHGNDQETNEDRRLPEGRHRGQQQRLVWQPSPGNTATVVARPSTTIAQNEIPGCRASDRRRCSRPRDPNGHTSTRRRRSSPRASCCSGQWQTTVAANNLAGTGSRATTWRSTLCPRSGAAPATLAEEEHGVELRVRRNDLDTASGVTLSATRPRTMPSSALGCSTWTSNSIQGTKANNNEPLARRRLREQRQHPVDQQGQQQHDVGLRGRLLR